MVYGSFKYNYGICSPNPQVRACPHTLAFLCRVFLILKEEEPLPKATLRLSLWAEISLLQSNGFEPGN